MLVPISTRSVSLVPDSNLSRLLAPKHARDPPHWLDSPNLGITEIRGRDSIDTWINGLHLSFCRIGPYSVNCNGKAR